MAGTYVCGDVIQLIIDLDLKIKPNGGALSKSYGQGFNIALPMLSINWLEGKTLEGSDVIRKRTDCQRNGIITGRKLLSNLGSRCNRGRRRRLQPEVLRTSDSRIGLLKWL